MNKMIKSLAHRINAMGNQRECTLCEWHGFRFLSTGVPTMRRKDVRCPSCGSLERHRLAFLALKEHLGSDHQTLHVAPEPTLAPWLKRISRDYLSIDIAGFAMKQMDLTHLDLPDECMTLVWCSHVLEHILDDRKAMREMCRVLKKGSRAVIQVPIGRDKTYEDSTITSPEDRLRVFFQKDHVRIYGFDVEDRLKESGFTVDAKRANSFSMKEQQRFRLNDEPVFVCRKQ